MGLCLGDSVQAQEGIQQQDWGKGKGKWQAKIVIWAEEGKERGQKNSRQKGMIKIVYCVVAALTLQTLPGACRASCYCETVRLWCQAGGARWAMGCRPVGAAPLAELLFLYTVAARHVWNPGRSSSMTFPLVYRVLCGLFWRPRNSYLQSPR